MTEKWKHRLPDRSEILVDTLKPVFFLNRLNLFSKYFRKHFEPTFYFDTTRLNKIFFHVRPSDITTPNNFRLVIDSILFPDMPKVHVTDTTESNIIFDKNYSNVVAENPIQYHFPSPGLVIIHYRIIDKDGKKPLDKNGKEIFLAQRTLSGKIGPGFHTEDKPNEGQIPIIILDYHQKILIKLTWALIYLTGILTILTLFMIFIPKK